MKTLTVAAIPPTPVKAWASKELVLILQHLKLETTVYVRAERVSCMWMDLGMALVSASATHKSFQAQWNSMDQ